MYLTFEADSDTRSPELLVGFVTLPAGRNNLNNISTTTTLTWTTDDLTNQYKSCSCSLLIMTLWLGTTEWVMSAL